VERKGDAEDPSGRAEERPRNQLGRGLSAGPNRADDLQSRIDALTERLVVAEAELAVKNNRLEKVENRLHVAEATARSRQSELDAIRDSVSWQLIERFQGWHRAWCPTGTRRRNVYRAVVSGCSRLLFGIRILNQDRHEEPYARWIRLYEADSERLKEMAEEAGSFSYRPLISIVVPVYRTAAQILRETIESVRNQVYANWELCLADDGSDRPEIGSLLGEYAAKDARIRFTQLAQSQGVSGATTAALTLARGEFIGFLDPADLLSADALYWVLALLERRRDADLIYSDEDQLNEVGTRCEPFFKPDWSPDLLLSMNYVGRFLIVRHSLVKTIGGLRAEYDDDQHYDLILRTTDKTSRIYHIPRVLYHRRWSQSSATEPARAQPAPEPAARRTIADYLARNQIAGHVEPGVAAGTWRVRYEIRDKPKVTVIIPTGQNVGMFRRCLDSLFAKTDYGHFDVMAVDNSKGTDVQRLLSNFSAQEEQLIYVDYRNRPFNFSAINNFAVRRASTPLVLFLNDDTEVVSPEWLTALVEHGQRRTVGVVGAKLLYPTGAIQHAGVVMGIGENAGHAFKHLRRGLRGYFDFPDVVRDCSAVTAACMLTKRDLFLELGGFNEVDLAVGFQDPDYCLRVRRAGYLVVYTPYCVLLHHESASRSRRVDWAEVRYMQKNWADVIAHDPYYSPNLTRRAEDYSILGD
jgi:GT2 family glycosyltransferase